MRKLNAQLMNMSRLQKQSLVQCADFAGLDLIGLGLCISRFSIISLLERKYDYEWNRRT